MGDAEDEAMGVDMSLQAGLTAAIIFIVGPMILIAVLTALDEANGNRQSRQGDDRSAEGSAATLAIDLATGAAATAVTLRSGSFTPTSVSRMAVPFPSQYDLMREYARQLQNQNPSVAQVQQLLQNAAMQRTTIYGHMMIPAELRDRHATAQCKTCGAAHREKDTHACLAPSAHDLAVVKTIQSLAEAGLDAEEIAGDMGLVIGWRLWGTGNELLAGATAGQPAPWRLDMPVLAICTDRGCFATEKAEACKVSKKPSCRVHAFKDRGQAQATRATMRTSNTLGMVALWGDVIECEKGLLATRAYPLAFESEIYARAYRVAKLPA